MNLLTTGRHLHATDISWALSVLPDDDPDDLIDWTVELGIDATTYRSLLGEALAVLADVTRDRDRLRARYYALLNERRRAAA